MGFACTPYGQGDDVGIAQLEQRLKPASTHAEPRVDCAQFKLTFETPDPSSRETRIVSRNSRGEREAHVCVIPLHQGFPGAGALEATENCHRKSKDPASLTVPRTENKLSVPRMLRRRTPNVELAHGRLLLPRVSFDKSWTPTK